MVINGNYIDKSIFKSYAFNNSIWRSKSVTRLETGFGPDRNTWIWRAESSVKDTRWGSKRRIGGTAYKSGAWRDLPCMWSAWMHVGILADVLETRGGVCMARRGSKCTDPLILGWDTTFGCCLAERSSSSGTWGSWRHYRLRMVARVVGGNKASTDR
jgi:hypothetical protein